MTNPGRADRRVPRRPRHRDGAQTPADPGAGAGRRRSRSSSRACPNFPFSAILSALESSGLAKMLAEPTLVALSGQEAKFLVGGEFPIPHLERPRAVIRSSGRSSASSSTSRPP